MDCLYIWPSYAVLREGLAGWPAGLGGNWPAKLAILNQILHINP